MTFFSFRQFCRASLRSCRPTRGVIALFILVTFFVHASTTPPKPKPSIIALSPHITEMLFSMGAGEQIIATTEFSDFPEAAKKIPRIGNYLRLQIERIIELQPDYIIAWRNGSPSADLARLAQLGFNIVYSEPKKFTDIASDIKRLGKLSGHEKRANFLADQFLTRLDNIVNTYKNRPLLPAFYELWSKPLTTIAKGSWPQQHLDICGVDNVFYHATSAYPIVGIEQVMVKNIKLIIVPLSKNQTDKQGYSWGKWKNINAVKNQQFIYPNSDKMHRMTLRALDELQSLCAQVDKVRQFYANKM